MNNEKMNIMLIEEFPELLNLYQSEVSWQEGNNTGSHIVYGDVFTPYFIECLDKKNEIKILKILNFIEHILKLDFTYSNEIIAFSVLERIKIKYSDSMILKKQMGILTSKIWNEIEIG